MKYSMKWGSSKDFYSLLSLYRVFMIVKGEEVITSRDRLTNCWAELDLNQRRHIANEFTVRPH